MTAQYLVLAADLWETGGIGTAMRDTVRVISDRVGPERCHVLSVRGRAADDPVVPADVVFTGPVGGEFRVAFGTRLRYAVRAISAARHNAGELVVFCGHPNLATLAAVVARVVGAPMAAWVYGLESWVPMPITTRYALRRADVVLAITEFTSTHAAVAQRLDPRRVRVLHLCVSTERRSSESSESLGPVARAGVVSVSRLNRRNAYKGVDTLIRSWPAVTRAIPDAHLTVIGDGDDLGRLQELARQCGVARVVTFRGRVSDPELDRAYAEAAVFALPGRVRTAAPAEGEGFGLVFIEAAAAGLPVVAGRAGGAPEAVDDNVTGLLVDPSDSEAIAEALVLLLRNPKLRNEMATAGSARARNYFSFLRFSAELGSVLDTIEGR